MKAVQYVMTSKKKVIDLAKESGSMETATAIESAQELSTARPTLSLDGTWDFAYDPEDVGDKQRWFTPGAKLGEKTIVPGCDQAQNHRSAGMSDEDYAEFHRQNGVFMMDLKYPTMAPAWHRKTFRIPSPWRKGEVWLHIGGVMPAATIWFNGHEIGHTVTSRCPISCNLTRHARFGGVNTLVVKTYWPEVPRLDGVLDFAAAFSGMYRSVRMESVPRLHIREIHIAGKINPPNAVVNVTLSGVDTGKGQLGVSCRIRGLKDRPQFAGGLKLAPGATPRETCSFRIEMPGASLWSPERPHLYQASVTLWDGAKAIDRVNVRFGLREIRCKGLSILLNGKPVFLRGACDDRIYPETICPPARKDFYVKRLRQSKKYGFNYTKSCMDIFTSDFLDAADEVGLLVCQEMPFGVSGKYRTLIRQEMPLAYQDLYRRELENIIRSDRNHPCIILYSMISEFGLWGMKDHVFQLFCRELPTLAKSLNPGALVIDITSARGAWSGNTGFGLRQTDLIEEQVTHQTCLEPLSHPLGGQFEELNRPFLLHEYAWWTSLSEPSLRSRYDRLPYKLNGVPELEEAAAKSGLSNQLPVFVRNSRKLKYALQKNGLEMARRNPRISGYHFWLINGFSWCQEGVFNEFFDEPRDLPAREFCMFNDDTVLLLDDHNHRSFECGRPTLLGIEVSHFGTEPLTTPNLAWQLVRGKQVVAGGRTKLAPIECGTLTTPCQLKISMPSGATLDQLELRAVLFNRDRKICQNHWTIWAVPAVRGEGWMGRVATNLSFVMAAYPRMKLLAENALVGQPVVVTDHMSQALLDYLDQGGRLVLLSNRVLKDYRPNLETRPNKKFEDHWKNFLASLYRSAPWNTAPGNMGTVIAKHPALTGFPHEGWCDFNFVHLISGCYAILLEDFHPQRVDPIIRSIGHQNTMVDKAYLYEIRVGKGALLATSLKFASTYTAYPETRYLLDRLLAYAAGNSFKPKAAVTKEKFAATVMVMKG